MTQKIQHHFGTSIRQNLVYIIPFLMAIVLMLPRLLSAQFGLMDDGVALFNAQRIMDGQWNLGSEMSAGRFHPLYWIIRYLLFLTLDENPTTHFLVNLIVLEFSLIVMILILKQVGSTRLQILATTILFVLSGPLAENYFTLSKAEIFQILFLLIAILLSILINRVHLLGIKLLLGFGSVAFNLIALLTKETSLILPFIYFIWAVIALFWYRKQNRTRITSYLVLLISSVLAILIYFFLRNQYLSDLFPTGSYVGIHMDFRISELINSMIAWEPWLRRDFAFCIPLIIAFILLIIMRRQSPRFSLLYLQTGVWILGWLGVLLPWVIKAEYFLLPFALGCSILSAHILGELFDEIKKSIVFLRVIYAGLVISSGILWIISLFLFYNNARYQLTMDRVNSQMVDYLAKTLSHNGVVYVNLPADSEYISEIQYHLNLFYNRPDINVKRFYYQKPEGGSAEYSSIIISPLVQNRPTFSVRYAFNEDDSGAWTDTLEKYMAGGNDSPVSFSDSFIEIDPHIFRTICIILPGINPCQSRGKLLEIKSLVYSWVAYPYSIKEQHMAQPGIYECGVWTLRNSDGTTTVYRFGNCNNIPVVGDWNGDGISDFGVYSQDNNTWSIDWNKDSKADLVFSLDGMGLTDIPLVGDWDGDGRDTPGYFSPSDYQWHLYEGESSHLLEVISIRGGSATSVPLVGDWNRDSKDTWGVYRSETGEINLENEYIGNLSGVDYTLPSNTTIIVGDWFGTGRDTLAFIDRTDWVLLPVNCSCTYSNFPVAYRYPVDDGIPVSGYWK